MTATPIFQMENVSYAYNGAPVLENVNLAVGERDFAYVVGPNGGGKTTLLKLLLGLIQPRQGTVRVYGDRPERQRRRLGYVPQSYAYDPLFPVRVIDVVLMGRIDRSRTIGPYRRRDRDIALDALSQVEVQHFRNRPLGTLSGGERQRVLIARALAGEPDVLLMDEPTASLDLAVETELYKLLDSLHQRMTVVMVSHDVGFVVPSVTKVICVNRRVFVHETSRITSEIITEMYGSDIRMIRHDERLGPAHGPHEEGHDHA